MSYTADQQADVAKNIAAVRANAGKHAQDFFIFWFKKSPGEMDRFANYKGHAPDSLGSVPQFAGHTKDVITSLLEFIEVAADPSALAAKAKSHCAAHKSRNLTAADYDSLFAALIPFLQQTLGGDCATAGWQNAGALVSNAIKAAM